MKRDCASGSMAAASSGPAELGASWRRRRPGGCAAAGSQARWAGGRRGWARRGCRALLAFLLQLCAPLPGRAHAFHRGLFCCRAPPGCAGLRVFRNQLPRKNDFYS